MKIVIINGSHRVGNCFNFAACARNILSANSHDVTVFNLIDMNIKMCTGCLSCEDGVNCPLHDDYDTIIEPTLVASDLIIMATPTYFNMPSAAMVNYIDRTNNLCEYFSGNHKKCLFYLVGQTDEDTIMDAYKCLHTYGEIMEMNEIHRPIISIARMPEKVSDEIKQVLNSI